MESSVAVRRYRPKSSDEIYRNMSAIRAVGGKAESELRSVLHRRGYRFRKNVPLLPGKPDIVFRRDRVVVFVDGDFWHGRILREQGVDAATAHFRKNQEYWREKLQRNVGRDLTVSDTLEREGWQVIRLWESEVRRDVTAAADLVEEYLLAARLRSTILPPAK